MFFDSWDDVTRIVGAALAGYAALLVMLRVSGKRTLAKLNAFDLVVTIALGSTLATIALSSEVAVVEGVIALAALIALQYVVAWLSTRSAAARQLVKATPLVVVEEGAIIEAALRSARLVEGEIYQAIRGAGLGDLATVRAVVLETGGTLSVIAGKDFGDGSAFVGTSRDCSARPRGPSVERPADP